ncbi:unnamed protein product [Effrenium voratum]|nr:unnamed protein product [Effrenium voratum]
MGQKTGPWRVGSAESPSSDAKKGPPPEPKDEEEELVDLPQLQRALRALGSGSQAQSLDSLDEDEDEAPEARLFREAFLEVAGAAESFQVFRSVVRLTPTAVLMQAEHRAVVLERLRDFAGTAAAPESRRSAQALGASLALREPGCAFEVFELLAAALAAVPASLGAGAADAPLSAAGLGQWRRVALADSAAAWNAALSGESKGYVLSHAVCRLEVGGGDVTEYLGKLLKERGYNLTTPAEREIVRDIKEAMCYVALDFGHEQRVADSSFLERHFELPQGDVLTLGSERFRCPEAMFRPDLLGLEVAGLHDTVFQSLMKCDADVRPSLYDNVVLSGGASLVPGFRERLAKELSEMASVPISVAAPPERRYGAWLGGALITAQPAFGRMWISKADYDAAGPEIVHVKCI